MFLYLRHLSFILPPTESLKHRYVSLLTSWTTTVFQSIYHTQGSRPPAAPQMHNLTRHKSLGGLFDVSRSGTANISLPLEISYSVPSSTDTFSPVPRIPRPPTSLPHLANRHQPLLPCLWNVHSIASSCGQIVQIWIFRLMYFKCVWNFLIWLMNYWKAKVTFINTFLFHTGQVTFKDDSRLKKD